MLVQTQYVTKDEEEVSALFFSTLEEAEEVKEFFDDSVELEIEEGRFYDVEEDTIEKGFFLFSRFQQEVEEQPDEATLQETGLIPVSFEESPED